MTLDDNMETLEAINKRKSIRAYKDEQITKEELDTIIGVANKAPNASPEREIPDNINFIG